MKAEDVKKSVFRWLYSQGMVGVTECTLSSSSTYGVSDIVGVKLPKNYAFYSKSGECRESVQRVLEIEVKVSKSDLLKDLEKRKWWFWKNRIPCTHFWYAVPASLESEAVRVAEEVEMRIKKSSDVPSRSRIGVLVCDNEFDHRVARTAIKLQDHAPYESLNSIIARAFWELYGMRELHEKYLVQKMDSVSTGSVWVTFSGYKRKRVKVTDVDGTDVHYVDVMSGRKGRSKIAGFCRSYRQSSL